MNKQNKLDELAAEIARMNICRKIIEDHGDSLSNSVIFSPNYIIYITVDNRDDLATLMTLAPKWTKTYATDQIIYEASIEGEMIKIFAVSAALPGTCKLVEEEYEVPAQEAKPAYKATRKVLKCNEAVTVGATEPAY